MVRLPEITVVQLRGNFVANLGYLAAQSPFTTL